MQNYRMYKPQKDKTGCASQWQLSEKKVVRGKDNKEFTEFMFFLEMAHQLPENDQNDNNKFDWDNSVTVKMGAIDLGEVIAVLDGKKDAVGGEKGMLYHETPGGGNKVVSFSWMKERGAFGLKVSAQNAQKDTDKIQHLISVGEASVLLVLLKQAIIKMYDWV